MSKVLQLVGFNVHREFFGVPIEEVKEIVRVPEITAVPDTPSFLNGVINLRGKIVPVIEMSRRLGAASTGMKRSNRVLVLDLEGTTVGLLVDSASEILKISEDLIEQPPGLVSSIGARYVSGVGKLKNRLIVLLNLQRLLSEEELRKAESACEQAVLEDNEKAGEDNEAGDEASGAIA